MSLIIIIEVSLFLGVLVSFKGSTVYIMYICVYNYTQYKTGLVQGSQPSSPRPHLNTDQLPLSPPVMSLSPYDTSIAWLELTLLCQCYGPLQQGMCTYAASPRYNYTMALIVYLFYFRGAAYSLCIFESFSSLSSPCSQVKYIATVQWQIQGDFKVFPFLAFNWPVLFLLLYL